MISKRGFTLLESLLSLTLFCFIFMGGLAFLGPAKAYFHNLKDKYETCETLYTAVDKIKLDLEQAGEGLYMPLAFGLVPGIVAAEDSLQIESGELTLGLSTDLQPGQTRIPLFSTTGLKQGRQICIFNTSGGESATIASIDSNSILLTQPLQGGYLAGDSWLILVRTVQIFLDKDGNLLRRKVNTSSAQPLLEDTVLFFYEYDTTLHRIRIDISTKSNERNKHAFSMRPKNVVLANLR